MEPFHTCRLTTAASTVASDLNGDALPDTTPLRRGHDHLIGVEGRGRLCLVPCSLGRIENGSLGERTPLQKSSKAFVRPLQGALVGTSQESNCLQTAPRYNMEDHCDAVKVLDVESVVKSELILEGPGSAMRCCGGSSSHGLSKHWWTCFFRWGVETTRTLAPRASLKGHQQVD